LAHAAPRTVFKNFNGDEPRAVPLSFVRKQRGLRNKVLLLTGEPRAGKFTLQNIIETMYNLDSHEGSSLRVC